MWSVSEANSWTGPGVSRSLLLIRVKAQSIEGIRSLVPLVVKLAAECSGPSVDGLLETSCPGISVSFSPSPVGAASSTGVDVIGGVAVDTSGTHRYTSYDDCIFLRIAKIDYIHLTLFPSSFSDTT